MFIKQIKSTVKIGYDAIIHLLGFPSNGTVSITY